MQNSRKKNYGLGPAAPKRQIYICNGCSEFTSDNRRSVRAHFGRSKSCKKNFEVQFKDSDRFYSIIQVRLGPQDHQAGGQSIRNSQGQRSTRPQSQDGNETESLQMRSNNQQAAVQGLGMRFLI